MNLTHIPLDQLSVSPLNVRKHGGRDIAALAASIRSLGVIQPLLVRPSDDGFEVVAGQRRLRACQALAVEGESEPLPCLVMAEGDDAAALEASLAENLARLPMDEIDQYRAFAALRQQGRSVAEIAGQFGVTERLVEQRLAIANLYAPILAAYRREEIEPATLRILTMATKRQQKAWWQRFRDPEDYAPQGHALKSWLFGGHQIPVGNALFDPEAYEGAIVCDLFGDDRYFADSDSFWRLQSKAVAELKERYLSYGWSQVVLCETGDYWRSWEFAEVAKQDGGRVYLAVTADGEVTAHEGFLPEKEARRRQAVTEGAPDAPERPECTRSMQNYLNLHRHAAVRVALLSAPQVAQRLMLAHLIVGSHLWKVEADPLRTARDDIARSVADSPAHAVFRAERGAVARLIGMDEPDDSLVPRRGDWQARRPAFAALFARLLELSEPEAQSVLAYLMAETLAVGSEAVETVGALLSVDMNDWWHPDNAFFDLLRDKEALNNMVAELAGREVAEANCTATAKVQKGIMRDCLSGVRQPKAQSWLPGYMAFPMRGYTDRFHSDGDVPTPDEADIDLAA